MLVFATDVNWPLLWVGVGLVVFGSAVQLLSDWIASRKPPPAPPKTKGDGVDPAKWLIVILGFVKKGKIGWATAALGLLLIAAAVFGVGTGNGGNTTSTTSTTPVPPATSSTTTASTTTP